MFFKLLHTSLKSNARIGKIQTDRGIINTPVFMPVGTLGTVKGINQRELINDINDNLIDKEECLLKMKEIKSNFPSDWKLPNVYLFHGDNDPFYQI